MAVVSETIEVSGIRCERCVNRLRAALTGHDGLESATANLMGEVRLEWNDERTTRDALVNAMAGAGFRQTASAAE
ncbi:MAG: cation transporter [Actinobacteria bacterium]|nr:cation transporter [Actinomycetota bacterium]